LWIFFFRVSDEIERLRVAKLCGRPPVPLFVVEDHFPILPFDRFQTIGHVNRKPLAIGFLGFAEQEIALIYSVNGTILWHRRTGDFRERRVCIDLVDDLVTNTASRDMGRPTDNERYSEGA